MILGPFREVRPADWQEYFPIVNETGKCFHIRLVQNFGRKQANSLNGARRNIRTVSKWNEKPIV
jgi:hypothetical protein